MLKIAALTTLALGFTCAAQPGFRGGKSQFPLTDSQRQNLSSLRDQHRQSTDASLQGLHPKERSLRDQLKAGNTDAASLGRLLIDIEASRKQVEASRQSFREQMISTLTADQKARLKVLEDARSLAPAIHEAERLGLLDGPSPFGEGGSREVGTFRGPRLGGRPGNRRLDQ